MSAQMVAALLAARHPNEVDLEELQRSESESLLANLISQRARLAMLSEMAFEQGEVHAATGVEKAITSSLELTSRLLGQLVTQHSVTHTNILISGDYLALRAAIIGALKPFPEAARAVSSALAQLETEAAEDIAKRKTPLLLEASPA
jgi:hypothetical protein